MSKHKVDCPPPKPFRIADINRGVLTDRLIPEQPEGDSLGMGIWLVLPLLMVIVLRTFAGDGWKDAALRPELKSNAILVRFVVY